MAVTKEYPYIDDMGNERADLVRHYSDCGKMILQVETGTIYSEAVDAYPCRYTYEETEESAEDYAPEESLPGFMGNVTTLEELSAAYKEGVNSL